MANSDKKFKNKSGLPYLQKRGARMHDAAVVQGIAGAVLGKLRGRKIKELKLVVAVGALRHIHDDDLVFWLTEMLRKEFGEGLEVKVSVETVRPSIKCGCGFKGAVKNFTVTHDMAHLGLWEMGCPKCGCKEFELLGGNDVLLKKIEAK
ncbi:MAG: hydrogenase/urease maturation nickel metallochaperone HypA [Candidatus Diapherotrites archaeon]|nr:hydrogenase/urease maturation nickel metallochaperone HypA [Candidatus Diapherotrites archaeon]